MMAVSVFCGPYAGNFEEQSKMYPQYKTQFTLSLKKDLKCFSKNFKSDAMKKAETFTRSQDLQTSACKILKQIDYF